MAVHTKDTALFMESVKGIRLIGVGDIGTLPAGSQHMARLLFLAVPQFMVHG